MTTLPNEDFLSDDGPTIRAPRKYLSGHLRRAFVRFCLQISRFTGNVAQHREVACTPPYRLQPTQNCKLSCLVHAVEELGREDQTMLHPVSFMYIL